MQLYAWCFWSFASFAFSLCNVYVYGLGYPCTRLMIFLPIKKNTYTASQVSQTQLLDRKVMWQVWAGPLSDNNIAVILWNRSSSNATVTASWSDIGLEPGTIVDARDLWMVRYIVTLINLFFTMQII